VKRAHRGAFDPNASQETSAVTLPLNRTLSSRACDTHSEVMEELAATAAVRAMDIDSDAEEDSSLEMSCDAPPPDGRDEQRVDFEVPE
jgi:hypothetical protein